MTIEATLERIAVALEIIAGSPGTVAAVSAVEKPAPEKAKESKPRNTKKDKAPKEEPKVEETTEEEDDDAPKLTLNDVRAALTALQKAKGAAAPKGLLEKFKAKTLSALSEDQFAAIIAKAEELTAEDAE